MSSSFASRYIPWDIIPEILFNLPVKSVIRFRSVAKPWHDLIDGPDFTKKYQCHSVKSNNFNNLKLIVECRHMLSVDLSMLQDGDIADVITRYYKPLNPAYVEVLACCNGLFCLYNHSNNTIILWNPSTMTHQNIPKIPRFESLKFSIEPYSIMGFSYDAVNDDYKLVGMTNMSNLHHNYSNNLFQYYVVYIYSLKSDSWRTIEHVIPYKFSYGTKSGIFVRSALHWIVVSAEHKIKIIAFDIETEKYRVVEEPECMIPMYPKSGVDVLGGNLCLLCSHCASNFYVDLWVMKEYGVKSSWIKLLSISYSSLYQCEKPIRPLVYSKCRKKVLLLMADSRIFWYDLEKKIEWLEPNLEFQPPIKFCSSFVCLDSLVRLKNSFRTSHTTSGKRKRKVKDSVLR